MVRAYMLVRFMIIGSDTFALKHFSFRVQKLVALLSILIHQSGTELLSFSLALHPVAWDIQPSQASLPSVASLNHRLCMIDMDLQVVYPAHPRFWRDKKLRAVSPAPRHFWRLRWDLTNDRCRRLPDWEIMQGKQKVPFTQTILRLVRWL